MEDGRAIDRCLEGDPDAYRHLVERYQSRALVHARVIAGGTADADDALQDAFLRAYRALDRFDRSRRFYPWFYVILRNCCLRLVDGRRRDVEARKAMPLLSLRAGGKVAEGLQDAVAALGPRDREIIVLRHFDGLSYAELAERLSVPRGTVMSRLYHARRRLAGLMREGEES